MLANQKRSDAPELGRRSAGFGASLGLAEGAGADLVGTAGFFTSGVFGGAGVLLICGIHLPPLGTRVLAGLSAPASLPAVEAPPIVFLRLVGSTLKGSDDVDLDDSQPLETAVVDSLIRGLDLGLPWVFDFFEELLTEPSNRSGLARGPVWTVSLVEPEPKGTTGTKG